MKPKISVGSSAVVLGAYSEHPVPLEDLADRLGDLGFQGIEIFGCEPYGRPEDYPTPSHRKQLVSMLRKRGLEISNYGADFAGCSPLGLDPNGSGLYRKLFMRNLEFCIDCEIPSMRLDTVEVPPLKRNMRSHEALKCLIRTWHECAEVAAKEEVSLVWEFEPGFVFNKPHEVLKIVKAVGHPNFKVLFDVCHAHMCAAVGAKQQKPYDILEDGEIELARILSGKIGYVHLIDSDDTLHDDWTSTHAPFGSGMVDFHAVVDAIIHGGYNNDWWAIDLCFWPRAWDILEDSKEFVDNLLGQHGLF